ncbi:MAG: hypothetical protein A2169_14460 [Deltaproteobacteria bacterium RBG_13_47_9]|nr:MAG: hypothetical protein A2169_14460 [Deltaproteobacteria bacterium RBG_13_47_9]
MVKATKVKEISCTMPNRIGLLSEITTAISGEKVNITAICAYAMETTAFFLLTTDSNTKAKKALAPLGVVIEEREVVEVEMPNKAGELQKVSKRIADACIDIQYMYGTSRGGKTATCVFKTADDKKAIKVINK